MLRVICVVLLFIIMPLSMAQDDDGTQTPFDLPPLAPTPTATQESATQTPPTPTVVQDDDDTGVDVDMLEARSNALDAISQDADSDAEVEATVGNFLRQADETLVDYNAPIPACTDEEIEEELTEQWNHISGVIAGYRDKKAHFAAFLSSTNEDEIVDESFDMIGKCQFFRQ